MIDTTKENLKNGYNIDAKYCDMTALIDELPGNQSVNIASEIYKAVDGTYYAVITYKGYEPGHTQLISALDGYEYIEDYDVYANYRHVAPFQPVTNFDVFNLIPHHKNGEAVPISNRLK